MSQHDNLLKIYIVSLAVLSASPSEVLSNARTNETYASRTLQQKNEFILPRRLTVGPGDHFQTAFLEGQQMIYYSASVNMAVKIMSQDLLTGRSKPLLEEIYDSKDPVLDESGSRLAFTSYQSDARGDICVFNFIQNQRRCVSNRATEDQSAFWVNRTTLGFLSRRQPEDPWSIRVVSLDETKPLDQTLLTGSISSPHCSPNINGSRWMVFTNSDGGFSTLYLGKIIEDSTGFRITDSEKIEIDLPGVSSFPRFDPDGNFIYFGQYTSDTNEDSDVDANDRSSIFRIRLQDILSKTPFFPEPITSPDQNCNYPNPTQRELFVTCGQQGAEQDSTLDVYRLPLSGILPTEWDHSNLLRGIETSRTYEHRILLLETLLSRFRHYRNQETYEKLLNYLILAEQLPAAIFYSKKLEELSERRRSFYRLMSLLLEARLASQQAEHSRDDTTFRNKLKFGRAAVEKIESHEPEFKSIVLNVLSQLLGESVRLPIVLERIRSPVLLHFYSLQSPQDTETQIRLFLRLAKSHILSEESQTYYAYEFLKALDDPSMLKNRSLILKQARDSAPSHSPIAELTQVQSQLTLLRSDQVDDPSNQRIYAGIVKMLSSLEPRYFVYRAALTRSLLYCVNHKFWNYMYFFSLRGLNAASTEDSEYSYARRQFLQTGLENAYGQYSTGKRSFAGDQFSATARLTDDLEAHHGFVFSRLIERRRKEIEEMYKNFEAQGYIRENLKYVEVLLELLDPSSPPNLKTYLNLREKMESITPGLSNPALRYFMIGYLSQNIYLCSQEMGNEDPADLERAHQSYMVTLDLAKESERITTPTLLNLALLHQAAGDHGQALAFFEARRRFPFEDVAEEAAFTSALGRAYFFNHRPKDALATIEAFLKKEPERYSEFYEKAAFYAGQAGEYKDSLRFYADFFRSTSNLSLEDEWKIKMGYAYALFKSNDFVKATQAFQGVLKLKNFEYDLSTSRLRLPPDHYRLLAHGFLFQTLKDSNEKLAHLNEKVRILQAYQNRWSDLFVSEEDGIRSIIRTLNQRAEIQMNAEQFAAAQESLSDSLAHLQSLHNLSSNPLDPAFALGLSNYFVALRKVRQDDPTYAPAENSKAFALADHVIKSLKDANELNRLEDYASFTRSFAKVSHEAKMR